MKVLYVISSGFMKLFTSIVILGAIYSNGYKGNIKWFILMMTIIWVFYPFYEYFREIEKEDKG